MSYGKHLIWTLCLPLLGCSTSSSTSASRTGAGGKADNPHASAWADHLRDHSANLGFLTDAPNLLNYTGDPEFIVLEFEASKGDNVSVTAISEDGGDPMQWLLTEDFEEILDKNDDSISGLSDSRVHLKVPETGTYLVALADVYRRAATFSFELKGATEADPDDFDEFMTLSPADKLNTVYSQFSDFDSSLNPGFSRAALRIVDELESPFKDAILAEFFSFRDACFDEGGTQPEVDAIRKGGIVYAVELSCVEDNPDVEWGFQRTVDAMGETLGERGQLGF